MIVGAGNYVFRSFRGNCGSRSKLSKVWIIRHGNLGTSTGLIEVGNIHFPKSCIGKRVRLKVEFVDEPNKVLDKNRVLIEPVSFEVTHY